MQSVLYLDDFSMIFWDHNNQKDNFCFHGSIFQWQIKHISHRSELWHLRRKSAVIFSKWLFFQNSLMISWIFRILFQISRPKGNFAKYLNPSKNQQTFLILAIVSIKGSVPEFPSWSRVNCFSVDTPVYRIIKYPEDNKPMPFIWFKGPHVADIDVVLL